MKEKYCVEKIVYGVIVSTPQEMWHAIQTQTRAILFHKDADMISYKEIKPLTLAPLLATSLIMPFARQNDYVQVSKLKNLDKSIFCMASMKDLAEYIAFRDGEYIVAMCDVKLGWDKIICGDEVVVRRQPWGVALS